MIFNDFRSFNRIERHHGDLARRRTDLVLGEAGASLLLPVPQHVALGRLGGLTRSAPLRAPVWCSKGMSAPTNGPPTLPPLARNSAMIFSGARNSVIALSLGMET
jgi:hypothetical protein